MISEVNIFSANIVNGHAPNIVLCCFVFVIVNIAWVDVAHFAGTITGQLPHHCWCHRLFSNDHWLTYVQLFCFLTLTRNAIVIWEEATFIIHIYLLYSYYITLCHSISPRNLPLPWGIWTLYNTYSLGPPEPPPQMASQVKLVCFATSAPLKCSF